MNEYTKSPLESNRYACMPLKNPILEFIKKNQKGIISMALSRVS